MTDRELLKLAAKAIGAELHFATGGGLRPSSWIRMAKQDIYWNPLTADGDALRLAVDLKLDISFIEGDTIVLNVTYGGPDKMYNTRRAIVHAAANIGKVMP